jgi:hypothetical protein
MSLISIDLQTISNSRPSYAVVTSAHAFGNVLLILLLVVLSYLIWWHPTFFLPSITTKLRDTLSGTGGSVDCIKWKLRALSGAEGLPSVEYRDPRVDLLHTRQNRCTLRKWYIPYLSRSCLLELKNALSRAKEIVLCRNHAKAWRWNFFFSPPTMSRGLSNRIYIHRD